MPLFRRQPGLVGAISLLLLGVYLVASFGVLPSPRVIGGWFGQLSGERYPCEDCGCGCASAKECWTHCCCHSEHERLIWAIENGVLPPKGVEFRDEQWIAASNAVKSESAHCALCVGRIKDELRKGIGVPRAKASICSLDAACNSACGDSATLDDAEKPAGGSCCSSDKAGSWPLPSMSPLACKGLEQLLTFSLPPAPPVQIVQMILPEPVAFVPEWPEEPGYASRALDVPEPPPRT